MSFHSGSVGRSGHVQTPSDIVSDAEELPGESGDAGFEVFGDLSLLRRGFPAWYKKRPTKKLF